MPKRKTSVREGPSTKTASSEETEESSDGHVTKKMKKAIPLLKNISWPDDDILELVNKIEESIPAVDTLAFDARMKILNWENIIVKTHSVRECQKIWDTLSKPIRKHRILNEIVSDIRTMLEHPKNSGLKHPDKPKQPFNSFLFFLAQNRKRTMKKHPDLNSKEFVREMGKIFRELPQNEKEKYETMAKGAREEYKQKLREFYEEHPELLPKKPQKRRKDIILEEGKRPPEKPKTPFELYVKVEAENQEADKPRYLFIKKCREQWNEMTDKAKLFWINWAEEQYDKYMEDMKAYVKLHPLFEPGGIKPVISKKDRTLKEKCLGKPQRPPLNSYNLFYKMILDSDLMGRLNVIDVTNYVSEKWKACSEKEKAEYKTRVEQMWEEYNIKLESYLLTLPPENRDKVRRESVVMSKMNRPKTSHTKPLPAVRLKRPEPPPLTSYKYFLRCYQGEENPSDVWESMDLKEKKRFDMEFMEKKRQYINDYEQYLKSLSAEDLHKLGQVMTDRFDTSNDSDTSYNETED